MIGEDLLSPLLRGSVEDLLRGAVDPPRMIGAVEDLRMVIGADLPRMIGVAEGRKNRVRGSGF